MWLPCSEWITCEIMRRYRNDSLINEHKSVTEYQTIAIYTIIQVLALFKLHTIKGGKDGRPAVEQLVAIRRCPLTSDNSRTGVQHTNQFNRRHNASSDCCRSGPQEDLQDRTTSPTLSCSCFVADSHDHLEFLQTWLSATGTITFKLFDAPLHESSAANSTIFPL